MNKIIETLEKCMDLDREILSAVPDDSDGGLREQLIAAHLELGRELNEITEDEVKSLDFDDEEFPDEKNEPHRCTDAVDSGMNEKEKHAEFLEEMKKQILSEKQLLPVFGSKSDFDRVTFLTTFTCYLLSRKEGEKMHSRKYMEDVKRVHQQVNIYYGKKS